LFLWADFLVSYPEAGSLANPAQGVCAKKQKSLSLFWCFDRKTKKHVGFFGFIPRARHHVQSSREASADQAQISLIFNQIIFQEWQFRGSSWPGPDFIDFQLEFDAMKTISGLQLARQLRQSSNRDLCKESRNNLSLFWFYSRKTKKHLGFCVFLPLVSGLTPKTNRTWENNETTQQNKK